MEFDTIRWRYDLSTKLYIYIYTIESIPMTPTTARDPGTYTHSNEIISTFIDPKIAHKL